MRFSINVSGLIYNIDCLTQEFYEKYAKAFECDFNKDAYNIIVTKEKLLSYQYYDSSLSTYLNEATYTLDAVIKHCLDYNRMIIHGAAISYKNKGYLFIAPSGTGKTTHIKLWKHYLNDDVVIINGDKPMLEFKDNIIINATPWNGKEGLGTNTFAPLKTIIVLKQSSSNNINKLNTTDSILNILPQCFYSNDKIMGPKVIKYIEKIVNNIPIYCLNCDISKQAFETCFNTIKKI